VRYQEHRKDFAGLTQNLETVSDGLAGVKQGLENLKLEVTVISKNK
jgi:hypothetical protein